MFVYFLVTKICNLVNIYVNNKKWTGINDVYFHVHIVNRRTTHIIHINGMLVIKR